MSVILNFENIYLSGNFIRKYPFKPLCWNVNINCDTLMLRSIAPAINLKTAGKYYSSGFLRSFSLASLASGYLWYSSFTAYAANNNSERENTICGDFADCLYYSRGIAGFTDQRTTFMRAQSAILWSRDFNLRVEHERKFLIREANISKTEPVPLLF